MIIFSAIISALTFGVMVSYITKNVLLGVLVFFGVVNFLASLNMMINEEK